MGRYVHAKRYIMLTLIEDSIRERGSISPATSGVYFRIVWRHGLSDQQVNAYARKAYELFLSSGGAGMYPEWILQQMDQDWMTDLPSTEEWSFYTANSRYIRYLLEKEDSSGQSLELLAEYVLSCMPGCRTTRRLRSRSTDYDIVCSMEGFDLDFRSEFGRYFVCECKDWKHPVDFSSFAKFCRVLDSVKANFGIIFSKNGLSGSGKIKDAAAEQIKVFQDRGMVIIVVDKEDLSRLAAGQNFTSLLRRKYEQVRLDIPQKSRKRVDRS
jgi:hypothetical protein